MKLGIALGLRCYCVGGQYYTSSQFNAAMWEECLASFDEVFIAHRVIHKEEVGPGEKAISKDGISVIEFPNSFGFVGGLKCALKMFWRTRRIVRQANVWHLHTPNIVSICIWFWLWIFRIPYSLELRGDQSINVDYLRLRGIKFPLLLSGVMKMFLWLHLSRPLAISTVSGFLIKLSKPRNNCPIHVISNARIPSELYLKPRQWDGVDFCYKIVCSGRLEAQKNPLGTMRVLAKLDEKGFTNWKFVWIGDGPLKKDVEQLSSRLNLSDKIEFLGYMPWDEIFDTLKDSDLFVLNSVAEGLPRAILEAMACALPVIGTRSGGWEDILLVEDTVAPLDDEALADKIYEVLTIPGRLSKMSSRNLEIAKRYSAEVLRAKKIEFYKDVRTLAGEFLNKCM